MKINFFLPQFHDISWILDNKFTVFLQADKNLDKNETDVKMVAIERFYCCLQYKFQKGESYESAGNLYQNSEALWVCERVCVWVCVTACMCEFVYFVC